MFTARVDFTRFQHASECTDQSAARRGNVVIKCCCVRLDCTGTHAVMLGGSVVNSELDRTSAGAAMMGNSMIVSGDSNENPRFGCVKMSPGADLIIGCIIDTHFSQRGRHGRLLTAVAHCPQDLGFGIDENTAMIIDKDKFTVFGEGAVTVIDGGAMTYSDVPYVEAERSLALADVKMHVLREGYKFDLKTRQMIIPKNAQPKVMRAGANENGKQVENQKKKVRN